MALTLTVGTNTYITRANAILYFEGALHGSAFSSASTTVQDQALVTATRMLDRQNWQGTKTSDAQALAWPRTGVSDREGVAIGSSTVPADIINAQCELALALINNQSVQDSSSNSLNTKRLKAGSAEIEYFRPTRAGRFPTIVQELIGYLLASSAGSLLEPYASGTCVESYFECNTFNLNDSYK